MGYEVTAQIEINQVDIVVDEDELEATSFGEFVRTGMASLAVIVLASAALYLAVFAVVTLGMSGLQ